MAGVCGNGTCQNIPGSFTCDCDVGFEATMMMQTCMGVYYEYHVHLAHYNLLLITMLSDVNECQRSPGLCKGGRCVNTPGSFRCECPTGLELTPDKKECKDVQNHCSVFLTFHLSHTKLYLSLHTL